MITLTQKKKMKKQVVVLAIVVKIKTEAMTNTLIILT